MTSVNPLNPLDYFDTTKLSEEYDFDGNGKVDIADYNYAIKTLEDEDPNNNVKFTKAQLDAAFSDILKNAGNVETVTAENAETIGNEIVAAIESGSNNPANAKKLNELQIMGKNLTKYIKQSADVAKFLHAKMQELKTELEDLEAKKKAEQIKYQSKENLVEEKKEALAAKIAAAAVESDNIAKDGEQRAKRITKQCIEKYKNGEYPNRNLADVISSNLAADGGFNTSKLNGILNSADSLGTEIKNLCSDIDSLVAGIKSITEEYNSKNTEYNNTTDLRNRVLNAANTASEQYQAGYQKRLSLREEIINKYKDTKDGIKRLTDFLDQGEMDDMPYADAWAILTTAFTDCGIGFDKSTGTMVVPYGNVYTAFIDAISKNYGVNVERIDEGFEDEETPPAPSIVRPSLSKGDPMSFNVGDIEYSFINDNNNDGKFNDASEFLGAAKGWDEMKAFDTDGDGIIQGEELKKLNMVALDKKTGQYTFTTAADSGITKIDLSSYRLINQKSQNNDVKIGSFSVEINGLTIQAIQSDDTERNLANNYSTLFGAEITDLSDSYKENPFMEEFVETTNTSNVVHSTTSNIERAKDETDVTVKSAKQRTNSQISEDAEDGVKEKNNADEEEKAEQKKAEEKEKLKKQKE